MGASVGNPWRGQRVSSTFSGCSLSRRPDHDGNDTARSARHRHVGRPRARAECVARCRVRFTLRHIRSAIDDLAHQSRGGDIFGRRPRTAAPARAPLDCRCNRAALEHICQSYRPLSSYLQHRFHDGIRHARPEPRGGPPAAFSSCHDQGYVALCRRTVSGRLLLLCEQRERAALGACDVVGNGTRRPRACAARTHAR